MVIGECSMAESITLDPKSCDLLCKYLFSAVAEDKALIVSYSNSSQSSLMKN